MIRIEVETPFDATLAEREAIAYKALDEEQAEFDAFVQLELEAEREQEEEFEAFVQLELEAERERQQQYEPLGPS